MGNVPAVGGGIPAGWPFDSPPLRHGTVNGVAWAVAAHPEGICVNGYARIPVAGHPWSQCADCDDLDVQVHGGVTFGPRPLVDIAADAARTLEKIEQSGDDVADFRPVAEAASKIPPSPAITLEDCGHWIGFDTAHGWDVWTPEELMVAGVERTKVPVLRHEPHGWDRVWSIDQVVAEAKALAAQVAAPVSGLVSRESEIEAYDGK